MTSFVAFGDLVAGLRLARHDAARHRRDEAVGAFFAILRPGGSAKRTSNRPSRNAVRRRSPSPSTSGARRAVDRRSRSSRRQLRAPAHVRGGAVEHELVGADRAVRETSRFSALGRSGATTMRLPERPRRQPSTRATANADRRDCAPAPARRFDRLRARPAARARPVRRSRSASRRAGKARRGAVDQPVSMRPAATAGCRTRRARNSMLLVDADDVALASASRMRTQRALARRVPRRSAWRSSDRRRS